MGVKLFERTPRGYYLTANGERLLPSAETIHEETRKIGREMLASHHGIGGIVRISTLEGFGNVFLAGRLPKFAAQYPNLHIELLTLQQIVALSRREADIAITLQPPDTGRFVHEKLTDYSLFVYGSRDYVAGRPPIRTREDLREHVFCGYIDDLVFVRGLDYLDEVAKGLRAKLQSSSLHAQTEAAIAGYGLCVLPAFIAARHPQLVPVLPDQVSLTRSYWLVTEQRCRAEPASPGDPAVHSRGGRCAPAPVRRTARARSAGNARTIPRSSNRGKCAQKACGLEPSGSLRRTPTIGRDE